MWEENYILLFILRGFMAICAANGGRTEDFMEKTVDRNSFSYRVKRDFRRNRVLYLMALLPVAYYIIFCYFPMYGAIISFKNYTPSLGILGSKWVGLKHFKDLFESPSFGKILLNTLRISGATIIFSFPTPIILALLLNELKSAKFAKVVQNITYMPHFISLVVVCGLVRRFTMNTGFVGQLVGIFTDEPVSLLNYPKYFVPVYVISGIWQEVGWNSIVYLAALTSVDEQLYEAALIDGANRWKQTIHITIPSILPTIVIMLILKIGTRLNVGFEKIILLYNDATMPVAEVISTYVYKKGLIEMSWSFSTAVGLFNSVVNFIFIIATNMISKKLNGYGLF